MQYDEHQITHRAVSILLQLTTDETRWLLAHIGFSQENIDRYYPAGLSHEEELAQIKPVKFPLYMKAIDALDAMSDEERAEAISRMLASSHTLETTIREAMTIEPEHAAMDARMVQLAKRVARMEEMTHVDVTRDRMLETLKLRHDREQELRRKIARGEDL